MAKKKISAEVAGSITDITLNIGVARDTVFKEIALADGWTPTIKETKTKMVKHTENITVTQMNAAVQVEYDFGGAVVAVTVAETETEEKINPHTFEEVALAVLTGRAADAYHSATVENRKHEIDKAKRKAEDDILANISEPRG